eukprot:scaffold272271_cov27-Tisochrysis_lutea.AAC.2
MSLVGQLKGTAEVCGISERIFTFAGENVQTWREAHAACKHRFFCLAWAKKRRFAYTHSQG